MVKQLTDLLCKQKTECRQIIYLLTYLSQEGVRWPFAVFKSSCHLLLDWTLRGKGTSLSFILKVTTC